MKSQSCMESLIEQVCNVGSGFLLSLVVWVVVIKPVFDIETAFVENLWITLIFTGMSVVRGWLWRRWFNA